MNNDRDRRIPRIPITAEEIARLIADGMLEGAAFGLRRAWDLAKSRIGAGGIHVNEDYFTPDGGGGPNVHRPKDPNWKW